MNGAALDHHKDHCGEAEQCGGGGQSHRVVITQLRERNEQRRNRDGEGNCAAHVDGEALVVRILLEKQDKTRRRRDADGNIDPKNPGP